MLVLPAADESAPGAVAPGRQGGEHAACSPHLCGGQTPQGSTADGVISGGPDGTGSSIAGQPLPTCGQTRPSSCSGTTARSCASPPSSVCVIDPSLFGVGLVLSFGAVADVPDVAVRVGEGSAVPAPPQLGRGLEDR